MEYIVLKTCCVQAEGTWQNLPNADQLPTTLFMCEANFSERNSVGLYRPIWLLVLLELENFLVLL